MLKIVLFDPAAGSRNLGDEIILLSVRNELLHLFPGAFITRISLHQGLTVAQWRTCKEADAIFVAGTNMLRGDFRFFRRWKRWQLTLRDLIQVKNVIVLGAGWSAGKVTFLGRLFYQRVYSQVAPHSVRDAFTQRKMSELGVGQVLNTACPTMWGFSGDFLEGVDPRRKGAVVTTLTDYMRDPVADKELIECLKRLYSRVVFWPQGMFDSEYFSSLGVDDVEHIPPSLEAYDSFLRSNSVDFVGTRLHGGIRAMQHKHRALVIAVDARAREIGRDTGLSVVERGELSGVESWVVSESPVELRMPWDSIAAWRTMTMDAVLSHKKSTDVGGGVV